MIERLIVYVDSLNKHLDFQCRTQDESEVVKSIVEKIEKEIVSITENLNMSAYGRAVIEDFHNWLFLNCREKPNFKKSRDILKSPVSGSMFFFIGPLRVANGSRGSSTYKFECFISKREEPIDNKFKYLYEAYPHPKNICQSSHLLNATKGLLSGNNLVFFPENILASDTPNKQSYAVFYFNKFYKIFHSLTIPLCSKIGLEKQYVTSIMLTEKETYQARCVWGYLHDYFHHIGPRPFDEQIKIKTKWFTGLLEEVKVDMQTLLTCMNDHNIPFAKEVSEFILLERLFRYPSEKTWSNNFDAGTGLFLQSFFFENKNLLMDGNKKFVFDDTNLEKNILKLIKEIEEIEKMSNEQYLINSQKYVYRYLRKNIDNYFDYPEFLINSTYENLIGTSEVLQFTPQLNCDVDVVCVS